MSFFLRYYKNQLFLVMKNAWGKMTLVFTLLTAYLALTHLFSLYPLYVGIPLSLAAGFGLSLLFTLLVVLFVCLGEYKTVKVFNTEGFSEYYLRLYEKERIIGRPYNENNTIVFTEIMVRSGHLNEAMQYFNMIHISESNVFAYTALIYLKLLAGIKAGNPAYSDRVWLENQHFISRITEKRNNAMSASLMFLGLVYTDCANGRYERALQQTVTYMNSKAFKRYKTCEYDFRIIHLFLLKVLGREAFNNLAPKLKADIEANSFLYDWEKPQYLIDYNNAVNGVYPW